MKQKLNLNDLKVESFITEVEAHTIKGGQETLVCLTGTETWNFPCTRAGNCPTNPANCDIHITGPLTGC